MDFKINPTIREINKYLNVVIEELLEKHGKVSAPEFDKELQETTGIAWKQVKNYRNHPKPGQRIRDNAKILNFVLECRKKDKSREARIFAILGLGGAGVIAGLFILINFTLSPRETIVIVQKIDEKQVEVRQIPNATRIVVPLKNWVLAIGAPTNAQIDLTQFSCKEYIPLVKSCRYFQKTKAGQMEVGLTFRGDFLTGYSLSINELGGELPRELLEQLSIQSFFNKESRIEKQIGRGIVQIESHTDDEEVSYMVAKNGPNGSVNAISLSISAKLWP